MALRDPSAADGATVRGGRRWAWGAGASLVAALAVLWAERRPIAVHFIDRALTADGVPARYRLERLGPGRQRLTGVVIGDPVHPDLIADWIETETGIGPAGPELTGVRVGRARLRARWVDGRLSFGAIDRLLPAGYRTPRGLPALALDVADARMRVETAAGTVGVVLRGHGRLDGGFEGRAAAVATTLRASGCALAPATTALRVWTRGGRVGLAGPVGADRLACGGTRLLAPRLAIDASLDPAAARASGRWRLDGGSLTDPRARAASVSGGGTIAAGHGAVAGRATLAASDVVAPVGLAKRAMVTGAYRMGADRRFDGELSLSGGSLATGLRGRVATLTGTPIGPIAASAAAAVDAAARSIDGRASLRLTGQNATVDDAVLVSPTGAIARFAGAAGASGALDGRLSITGGGLPSVVATMRRATREAPLTGLLTMRPYAAGSATLTASPIAVVMAPSGEARLATVVTIDGPLGSAGRIERLTMPLRAKRLAAGAIMVGERCAPLSFARLTVGGLGLDTARLTLCPLDGALLRVATDGAIGGGARSGAVRLGGRLGGGPIAVGIGGATARLETLTFAVTGIAATLGHDDRPTRLAAASLAGTVARGGVEGRFVDATGRIGAVPLRLTDAEGRWRLADGVLALAGALTVDDAAAAAPACPARVAGPTPRFCPMRASDVALRLADGRIAATATLVEPTSGARVAGVSIAHDLTSGAGHADLAIDHLAFAKAGLQPTRLTPIVEGVIADAVGTIEGKGAIGWNERGVASTGRFATDGLDIATTIGPVTGIVGAIDFTDLLGLVSAPGQQVTVASINPGVAVENGAIRFHTEAGVKVAIESARWPFAGGTLTLDPALLDFSAPAERHMTFRLERIAADRFLQQFDFKNLAATGTFDGALPMVFDAGGGRIEAGRLTVREGGGGLAYVGEVSGKDLGFWGNLAFQALKSLRYRRLAIALNGPLDGEMVTEVRFAGVSQGAGAKSNFLIRRLQRLPFVFNVRITAPFRTLLDGLDPAQQVKLHLRELIDNARRPDPPTPVQPPASKPVP